MTDILQWTDAESEQFTHKFEELIHGPQPARKVGFITIVFPVEEDARAKMYSNVNRRMIINVMYQLLKALANEH
jgi:hypothetical protein